MTRKSTNFNIGQPAGRVAKPSVFDRIVKEIDAREIPARYIEQILVHYHDGNTIELSGQELSLPIPLNKNASWEEMEHVFKKMKDVKIFISTEVLEKDINEQVENILGTYC